MEKTFIACIETIKRTCNPFVIYLFGSFAKGEYKQDSDIDIAFLSETTVDGYTLFMLAGELAELFGREVDLIDLKTSSTVFKAQVVGTSKVLYCNDEQKRLLFEMRALKEYALLNEEREPILRRIKEEKTVYGR